MEKSAIIIGGGIHGLTLAIELAKDGFAVTILEKKEDILAGTSGATQNRAHLGYHYPRSKETAIECRNGLEFFKNKYPESLIYPKSAYYLIEKDSSKTTEEEFKNFCNELNIPNEKEYPKEKFVNRERVCGSFKVPEPVFDLGVLKEKLKKEANELGIIIALEEEVSSFKPMGNKYEITTKNKNGKEKIYIANFIFNTTYAYANNIMKILNLEEDFVEYILQTTEVPVMESDCEIPALTVMDGEFFSILPFGKNEKLVLLYDVINSVISKEKGFFLEEKTPESNIKAIIEHGKKYYPFIKDLKYKYSLYGHRPIPVIINNDSRKTNIKVHTKYPGIYSILEGKFISAPLIAKEVVGRVKNDFGL